MAPSSYRGTCSAEREAGAVNGMLPTSLDSRNRVVFAAPGHGHSHQETVPGHADLGSSAQHRTPEDVHPVPSLNTPRRV